MATTTTPVQTQNGQMTARDTKMKILVIDDARTMRTVARLSLTRLEGMNVLEAASGAEGLEVARREHPDAVLLDVQMPSMDGPATLMALSRDPATSAIPVIFMTASPSREEVQRLQRLGAVHVLSKPFDPRYLHHEVAALLQKPAYASVA